MAKSLPSSHCCSEYPYNFLELKSAKREPGVPRGQPRILKFTYELPHRFDYFFWDLDEKLINKFAQYFHVARARPGRKYPGFLFAYLSLAISYACNMELLILLMLWLSLNSYDGLAWQIGVVLSLNALIGQAFKRFVHRKRPHQFQPPRAFLLEVGI